MPLHPTAAKVQERLRDAGLAVEVRELADSTRTAAEAAAAVGAEIGQIVKSRLRSAVFEARLDALLVAVPGASERDVTES